jgi:hypothetical protein
VVSGSIPSLATGDTPTELLAIGGGITVLTANTVGAGTQVVIDNATSVDLVSVAETNGTTSQHSLPHGTSTSIAVGLTSNGGQIHIQIFPSGQAFPTAVTIIVSIENADGLQVVGQAFAGAV